MSGCEGGYEIEYWGGAGEMRRMHVSIKSYSHILFLAVCTLSGLATV